MPISPLSRLLAAEVLCDKIARWMAPERPGESRLKNAGRCPLPHGLRYFQIDGFAEALFGGNPAGVCLLADWLPAERMPSIAAENQLAETASVVQRGERFDLHRFTPEIELFCRHRGDRVGIAGRAVTDSSGFLQVSGMRGGQGMLRRLPPRAE